MKKMKKKISFLTKIFLVICMLFSNLSSLSVVFAYEVNNNISLSLNEDDIVIAYSGELEDNDDVSATITENYTYLDGSEVSQVSYVENFLGSELTEDGGASVTSQILSNVKFDGLYELTVELYNDTLGEEIGMATYSYNKEFETGFKVTVFDENDVEIIPVDGVYKFDTEMLKIKLSVNSGKLSPSDVYSYEDEELTATELLEKEFVFEERFFDALYGEYAITEDLEITSEESENLVFDKKINVMYQEYSVNADELNRYFDNFNGKYVFESDAKDGILYVYEMDSEKLNSYELIQMIYDGYRDVYDVKFSNSESEDILADYDEESSLEEYLKDIELDNTFVISITCNDLTITFKAVVVGDVNGDGQVNEDDFDEMIKEVISEIEADVNQDLNNDGKINVYDAAILRKILSTGNFNDLAIDNIDGRILGSLDVLESDIVSGDEVTVDYTLTIKNEEINAFSGQVSYDHNMLELVEVINNTDYKGSSYEGNFAYVGDTKLAGKEVEEETEEVEQLEQESPLDEVEMEEQDYTVLTFKFRALKSGTSTISIENAEFANEEIAVFVSDYESSVDVIVNESSDNDLSSLFVNGNEIVLEEGKLDYTIDVENYVTTVSVEAVSRNVAANVLSIVGPEELVEGENVFTITVAAENGDEKIYTVTVNRAQKQETTVAAVSYENDTTTTETTEVTSINDTEEDDVEITEENGNLSRIIIIVLILLVIAGLIYLIFKDDEDDTNKQINKMKKDNDFLGMKEEKKELVKKENTNKSVNHKPTNKNNSRNNGKNTAKKNNTKKER